MASAVGVVALAVGVVALAVRMGWSERRGL